MTRNAGRAHAQSRWGELRNLPSVVLASLVIVGASIMWSAPPQAAASPPSPAEPLSSPAPAHAITASRTGTNWGVGVHGASACNPLGGQSCMLPFPSDYYTVPDHGSPSGRRVDFPLEAMPANDHGIHIDPSAWNSNDGFSPGSTIEVEVPDLDPTASKIVNQYHIGGSLAAAAPVVLLDATTGQRLAWWGELDIRNTDTATRLLVIHPAADLPEGHRIVVALRNLRSTAGTPISASGEFAEILSGATPGGPGGAALAAHEKRLLKMLRSDASVGTKGLYLAWDFTVISRSNLTGPILAMRDAAMSQLGSRMPTYTVSKVTNLAPSATGGRTIARQVVGTFDVPNFLTGPTGDQTDTLLVGAQGMPRQKPGNLEHAVFACLIPRSVDAQPASEGEKVEPGRPVLYGKGLFSVATEMDAVGVRDTADAYRQVLCSTNTLGLDGNDEITDAGLFANLSDFPVIPDHLMQAMIDNLYLGHLLSSAKGFAANLAFRSTGPKPAPFIDTKEQGLWR